MRKLFTTLKSIVVAALAVSMVGVTSCSYDDTDLKNRVNDLEQDVDKVQEDLATLEQRVADLEKKVSDEVAALKGLIKDQVVVSNVVEENGAVTVTLSDGTEFTVYPKANPTDTNTDTYISVKADEITGVYYWAIFNEKGFVEFLKVDGERVAVFQEQEDTCEPVDLKFQVNDKGNIEFSIDGGKTWTDSGVAVGACDCEGTVVSTGACIFKNVVVRDHYVTFTLADGSEVVVFLAEFITFEAGRSHFYVKPAEVKALPFTVNEQVEDISVMNQPMGWKASVELAEDQEGVEPSKAAYVLNIEGPSKYLVGAGVAEKTGYIQLHITTVTGACKVVKVAVDLAEITLDVDAEGNVTIVNTLVDSYEQYQWWNDSTVLVQEFNNAQIFLLPLDYYQAVDGDLTQLLDQYGSALDYEMGCDYTFFNNLRNNIDNEAPQYEEGVYEKAVLEFNLFTDLLTKWGGLSDDDSFVIVVAPCDPQNQGMPIYDEAIAEEFKQVFANAIEKGEEFRTHNNAYFNIKFKGADAYYISFVEKAMVDEYLMWGYSSVEEVFYGMLYLESGFNYIYSCGMPVAYTEETMVGEYSFTDLFGEYVSLVDDCEYYMVVIPVEDGQTSISYEDLAISTFATTPAPIVEVDALSAAARFSSNHSYETLVDFVLPDNNSVTVRFRTGDGGWDKNEYYNRGMNYINIGEWNTYSNKGDSSVWHNAVTFNGQEVNVKGAIVVDYTADKGYSFTFTVSGYKVTYVGFVDGLVVPVNYDPAGGEGDDSVTKLYIAKLEVGYDQPGEKELLFHDSNNKIYVFDFKGSGVTNGSAPAAGTYSIDNYLLDSDYTIFEYGGVNGKMSSAECVVTHNGDGTQTYDVKFTYEGQNYAFVYTGAYPA